MKNPQRKYNCPEKGYEDYEINPQFKPHKMTNLKISQASQTFFRIKNLATPTIKASHYRTNTMNSNRYLNEDFPKENQNDIFDFNLKKSINLDDFMNDHDVKMKNIENLAKIKRKCNEFLESEDKIMSSETVHYLFKGVKILSNHDFEYKELISMYPILFQNALYINSELLNEYKSIIDQFDNERIKNYLKLNRINKCPYTVFCGCLLEEHRNKLTGSQSTITSLLKKNQELTDANKKTMDQLIDLQEAITQMKTHEKTSPHSTKIHQMQLELAKMETENSELKINLDITTLRSSALENDMFEYKSRLEYLQNANNQNEDKLDILAAEKEKIIKDYENKITNFKAFKQQAGDLKNVLDKMIMKMSTIKNHFLKSQQEKSDLIQERHELVIRAAAGFENLTPRPNYSSLCFEKNLKLSNLVPKSDKTDKKKKNTSIFIVDGLLSKICEYQAKIALMDSELKDRKKMGVSPSQVSSLRKGSISQINQKVSFNRVVGSISPNKLSKMLTLESIEKKSKFVSIGQEDEVKSSSNAESPNKYEMFDFKMDLKKEGMDEEHMVTGDGEEAKETEKIIQDIIESKKMIELFEINKL